LATANTGLPKASSFTVNYYLSLTPSASLSVIGNTMAIFNINSQYPFKVWGISILLGPFFTIIYGFLTSTNSEFDIPALFLGLFLAILFGIVFSIPAFLIYYFSYRLFRNTIKSETYLKLMLTLIAISCMIVTFYLLLGKEFNFKGDADFLLPYAGSIIVAGQLAKASRKEKNCL
jgi:hypothetical protein